MKEMRKDKPAKYEIDLDWLCDTLHRIVNAIELGYSDKNWSEDMRERISFIFTQVPKMKIKRNKKKRP